MSEKQSSSSFFGCIKSTFCCISGQDVTISESRKVSSVKPKEDKQVVIHNEPTKPVVNASAKQSKPKIEEPVKEITPNDIKVIASENSEKNTTKGDVTPLWLTPSFVESVLQSNEPGIRVISPLNVTPAVPEGENYSCIVYRVKFETSNGLRALIFKCIPSSEFRAKLIRDPMTREIDLYENTLPFIKGNYDKPNVPQYYSSINEQKNETLILDDMFELGYKTSNRRLGLNNLHCKLAITELAYFHAHSIALRINEPTIFETKILEKYPDVLYNDNNRLMMASFLDTTLSSLSNLVRTKFQYRFHVIADAMDSLFGDNLYDKLHKLNSVPQSKEELDKSVITLLHGDFWCNNLLFQYNNEDNEKPQACTILDFQASRCASPVIDLLYFFFTSTTQELRREYLDSLLQHYIDEVCVVLFKKGISHPGNKFYTSLSELKKDMKDKALFGLVNACLVMPIVISDPNDAPSIYGMSEEEFQNLKESPLLKLYSGPLFFERFREILEDMDDMEVFKTRLPFLKKEVE